MIGVTERRRVTLLAGETPALPGKALPIRIRFVMRSPSARLPNVQYRPGNAGVSPANKLTVIFAPLAPNGEACLALQALTT